MELLHAIVMGAIQGITEFLPISSSAHLIVVPQLLGWDDPFLNSATFDVMLHAGTLVALFVYFWRDVVRLLTAAWAAVRERTLADDPDRRLALLLLISTVPAALLGVAFESFFDHWFRDNTLVIPVIMLVGALFLWVADRSAGACVTCVPPTCGMPWSSVAPRRSPCSPARAAPL